MDLQPEPIDLANTEFFGVEVRPQSLPESIGDYEILEKIGQGGMGVVYKGRHKLLNQIAAIKILPKNLLADPQASGRFDREIQLIGSLNHPNVVRALNAGGYNGAHYLAMEFVDGVTLEQLVHDIKGNQLPKMPFPAACEAVRQAALGLQNAHELQLVHRDIKPANLMVDQSGTVKILDLGLGKFTNDTNLSDAEKTSLTLTGMTLGTVDYISPEQCENAANVDIRSDLYSLGCTLYYFLTGLPVYSGTRYSTLRKKLMAHIVGSVPSIRETVPELPESFDAVLRKVLAKNPAHRYQTPEGFAAALQPFASFDIFYDVLKKNGAIHLSTARPASSNTLAVQSLMPINRWKLITAVTLVHLLLFGGIFAACWYWLFKPENVVINGTDGRDTRTRPPQRPNNVPPISESSLLLLPGLQGNWWFNEAPWMLPKVRDILQKNYRPLPPVHQPANTPAFRARPVPFIPLEILLANNDVAGVYTVLWKCFTDNKKELSADVQRLAEMLYEPHDTEVFYRQLLNTVETETKGSGEDWHTQALLEHKLALLTKNEDYKNSAAEHYQKALAFYRAKEQEEQDMQRRAAVRLLEVLCLCDFARLPDDAETQKSRFNEIDNQRQNGERFGAFFMAEYRLAFGKMLISAGQYEDGNTKLIRAKETLTRDKENNAYKLHPLYAEICEQYGRGLLAKWKIAEADSEMIEALKARIANDTVSNDTYSFVKSCEDLNIRALIARLRGNSTKATADYRETLGRLKNDEKFRTIINETKVSLADCFLFGGAASEPATLAEMQKMYTEAESPAKAAIVLIMQNKLEEARQLLAKDAMNVDLAHQLADSLLVYKELKIENGKLTAKDSQRPTSVPSQLLRQFLQQFLPPNDKYGAKANRRSVMELRFFAAEFLLTEDLKTNEFDSIPEDSRLLEMLTVYVGTQSDLLKPYIRRRCDLLVRANRKLYEHSDTAQNKRLYLEKIVWILAGLRKNMRTEQRSENAELSSPHAPLVSAPLPTQLVFFLTNDPQDGFVIFYPQDGRMPELYPLLISRRDVKSGGLTSADHQTGPAKLPPELLMSIEKEHLAGRTVETSWSDTAAFSTLEEALTDADYPFN